LKEEIEHLCNKNWEAVYLEKSQRLLVFGKDNKKYLTKSRADSARDFGKKLEDLVGDSNNSLIWGFSIDEKLDLFIFPTGNIRILFKEQTSIETVWKLLAAYKDANFKLEHIEWQQRDVVRFTSKDEGLFPEYIKWAQNKGISLPETDKRRGRKVSYPVAMLQLRPGTEFRAFDIASDIASHAEVLIATPSFDAFGQNIANKPATLGVPPITDYNDVITRNLVHRTWEMFYPFSQGPLIPTEYDNRFLCSDASVVVLDHNFYDHRDIRFQWVGFDAADGDADPRSPLDPPDIDTSSILYTHGTEMSGVIAGLAQSPGWETGVAPGTIIIPIRPVSIEEVDLSTREGTDQYVAEYYEDWWNSLHRLFTLSHTEGVEVANFSGTANRVIFEATGLTDWLSWFLNNGGWGTGIFLACSAGNNPESQTIALPASNHSTFAVGWADWTTEEVLGNSGYRLDLTVDTGRWPEYWLNDELYHRSETSGGSSVSCAVVSGMAALMQMAGTVSINAEEKKQILRYTTRLSPIHQQEQDENGWHPKYGYGFLDAHHAVKVAYKDFQPPIQAVKARFLPDGTSTLLIQAGHPSNSTSFANEPSGVFWNLKEKTDSQGIYWGHVRTNGNTRHCEEIIDPISPMGHLLAVADFDGDGKDEIALQLGYWVSSPDHCFTIEKYNDTDGRWYDLGQSYGGIPGVEFIWNVEHDMSQILPADLEGSGKALLVARQNQFINAAKYNSDNDIWEPFGTANYEPSLSSLKLQTSLSLYSLDPRNPWFLRPEERLLHIAPFIRINGCDTLLVIGLLSEPQFMVPEWINSLVEFPKRPISAKQYLTASILRYDIETSEYINIPLDNHNNTHIMISEYQPYLLGSLQNVIIDDLDNDNEMEAVVVLSGGKIILVDFYRATSSSTHFDGHSVYNSNVNLSTKISKIHPGDVNSDGRAELAYLTESTDGRKVLFLTWNAITRDWETKVPELDYKRNGNQIVDILVGDFNEDSFAEIGLLMEKPHRNTFRVFRWDNYKFKECGVW